VREVENLVLVLGKWDSGRQVDVDTMNKFARRVERLPPATRSVLCIAARRASALASGKPWESLSVSPGEVHQATGLSLEDYLIHQRTLEDHRFIEVEQDFDGRNKMYLWGEGEWEKLPQDVVNCCIKHGISPSDIFEELRFDKLDGVETGDAKEDNPE
jgi:hypothetical protein